MRRRVLAGGLTAIRWAPEMKSISSIFVVLLCIGCASPGGGGGCDDARKAKQALLDLMRADGTVFEGADPARFDEVQLKPTGDGKFSWGSFTIDPGSKVYSAQLRTDTAFWSYQGKCVVTPFGKWRAENLSGEHGTM